MEGEILGDLQCLRDLPYPFFFLGVFGQLNQPQVPKNPQPIFFGELFWIPQEQGSSVYDSLVPRELLDVPTYQLERSASGVRRTTMASDSCSACATLLAQLSPGIISRVSSHTSRPASSRTAATFLTSCSSVCAWLMKTLT